MSQTTLEFIFAHDADVGARSCQEDCVWIGQPNGREPRCPVLAVLADGMGGHVAGERASKIAVERYVKTFSSGKAADVTIPKLLEQSLVAANDAIDTEILRNPALGGMGCTLVAAYVDDQGLRWASVGDSSLLLYRGREGPPSELHRLNEDHSIAPLLEKQVKAKLISAEEARNDPRRHALRSALTGAQIPLKEIVGEPLKLCHGDWIILASDGLETLPGNEIATIIGRHRVSGKPDDVVRDLLAAIRKKAVPNQDNVSIAAIRVDDLSEVETLIITPLGTPAKEVTAPVPQLLNPDLDVGGEPRPAVKRLPLKELVAGAIVLLIALAMVLLWNDNKGRDTGTSGITGEADKGVPSNTGPAQERKITNSPPLKGDERPHPAESQAGPNATPSGQENAAATEKTQDVYGKSAPVATPPDAKIADGPQAAGVKASKSDADSVNADSKNKKKGENKREH